jgi:hypothetical protein
MPGPIETRADRYLDLLFWFSSIVLNAIVLPIAVVFVLAALVLSMPYIVAMAILERKQHDD